MRHLTVGLVGLVLVFEIPATATAEPILHYTFDDQSDPTANSGTLGSAYDGQLYGQASFVPFGSGSAVSLDGVGDFVIPGGDNSVFNIGDGDFSLFARITTSNYEPGESTVRGLIWKEHIGGNPNYSLTVYRDSGLVQLAVHDGNQSVWFSSTVAVNDGVPHEILGVREGNMLRVYIDGSLDNSASIPAGFGSTHNANDLVIGGRTVLPSSADDFDGIIDEVAVFTYAIPEPSALALLGIGALGLLGYAWRRRRCG